MTREPTTTHGVRAWGASLQRRLCEHRDERGVISVWDDHDGLRECSSSSSGWSTTAGTP
jgi:hypothetical protein